VEYAQIGSSNSNFQQFQSNWNCMKKNNICFHYYSAISLVLQIDCIGMVILFGNLRNEFTNERKLSLPAWSSFPSLSLSLSQKRLLYKKFACLMLMKLTAGVNFIKILLEPFSYKKSLAQLLSNHCLALNFFFGKEYWCKSCS